MSPQAAAAEKNIFRKTNTQIGRNIFITPTNSSMRHLAYGRIRLNAAKASVAFFMGELECALIWLSCGASVTVDNKVVALTRRDAMNISLDPSMNVPTTTS